MDQTFEFFWASPNVHTNKINIIFVSPFRSIYIWFVCISFVFRIGKRKMVQEGYIWQVRFFCHFFCLNENDEIYPTYPQQTKLCGENSICDFALFWSIVVFLCFFLWKVVWRLCTWVDFFFVCLCSVGTTANVQGWYVQGSVANVDCFINRQDEST